MGRRADTSSKIAAARINDLSEFNILLYNRHLFVIDFPQAVDLSSRVDRYRYSRFEEARPLLLRDLRNVEPYFARFDTRVDAEEDDLLIARFERLHLNTSESEIWILSGPSAV